MPSNSRQRPFQRQVGEDNSNSNSQVLQGDGHGSQPPSRARREFGLLHPSSGEQLSSPSKESVALGPYIRLPKTASLQNILLVAKRAPYSRKKLYISASFLLSGILSVVAFLFFKRGTEQLSPGGLRPTRTFAAAVTSSSLKQDGAIETGHDDSERLHARSNETPRSPHLVSRVGFGSCSARVAWPQPIWPETVIPADPHAWIWAGDMAYMDFPEADCKKLPSHPQCNCTKDWLRASRWGCLAGDLKHGLAKLRDQIQHPDYAKFLEFMCPGYKSNGSLTPRHGVFELPQLSLCPRPILGTWDDHDYNWQDGNRRLPNKEETRDLFLDALGEPASSTRRQRGRGIHTKHVLNAGVEGREIEVLLLDARFQREPKPCAVRRDMCERAALTDPQKDKYAWCLDFLRGGPSGNGTCCKTDEEVFYGWCRNDTNKKDLKLWHSTCDPTHVSYGKHVGQDSPESQLEDSTGQSSREKDSGERRATAEKSTLGEQQTGGEREGGGAGNNDAKCEMLGSSQSEWLVRELEESTAPLVLLVTGSPLFNNPQSVECAKALRERKAVRCSCFDDWDCYRPAQVALLHAISRTRGCVVVITGDFHFSDIKVLKPGQQLYSEDYMSSGLSRPIYQVMASGLSSETASRAVCDTKHEDRLGLRVGGKCNFQSGPAFGVIEVDWESPEPMVSLQVRGHPSMGAMDIQQSISLKTCSSSSSSSG